ncbi:hypothetical protein CAPTEDRAFT_165907 [Capitella teleta]|uniref:Uncharacterized protein n=1 Tax=Capitella teleta TaxID=283909 RepID=R7U6R9_CAPTE|nr:hypothetical protein CAPTEDRAFT_165907 [Capitella teleta]|eukprot:ELU02060.1 hypothetical protein CAPTEDRAFT_165907 [Capitella teleta]
MWNTPKAGYSAQTQKLLKDMMQESKLNNFQKRQLNKVVSDGSNLPSSCHPTSSAKPRLHPQPRPQSKVINPREHSVQIRTKEEIESTGAYEREQFIPMPMSRYRGFYEEDKIRLANMMAYGEDLPPKNVKKARAMGKPKPQPKVDRFDELEKEVEERRSFLEEMVSLGKGHEYKAIIETEISRLIRDMELIDKKRSDELARLIAAEQKESTSSGIPHASLS